MSLRRRLALLSAATVAVAIILASAIIYVLVRDSLRSGVDDDLRDAAQRAELVIGGTSQGTVLGGGAPAPFTRPVPGPAGQAGQGQGQGQGQSSQDAPGGQGDEVTIPPPPDAGAPEAFGQVIEADGDVIRTPGPGGAQVAIPISDPARELAKSGGDPVFEDADSDGTSLRVLTQPLPDGGALQVARSLAETDDTLSNLVLILFLVSAGGIGLAAALGPLVARAALAPAAEVSEAAEEVARTHDLTHRIEVRGDDELGRLTASFNQMLEALQRSEASQRRLVADASHELRTPLATLRTNIETLGRGDRLDAAEKDRLVEDVTDELEEMTELVADIVELAREPRDDMLAPQEIRLDELAHDSVERARRRARELTFNEVLSPSVVVGDPARVGRAISNLLDNAAKWSPEGGEVELTIDGDLVRVRDHGPGFPPEDIGKVFDRFWRADEARGRPGSGLGLAIVQRVAEDHGGSVSASNAADGGAVVELRLPAHAQEPS